MDPNQNTTSTSTPSVLSGSVPDLRVFPSEPLLHQSVRWVCLRLSTIIYDCLRWRAICLRFAYDCLRLSTIAFRLPTIAYDCLRLPTTAYDSFSPCGLTGS